MNDDRYKNLINNLNFNIPTLNFQKYYESTDSFKALKSALESITQQMLPTKLMMGQFTESYLAMLEPISKITDNYRNMFQPLFESEEFKQAIASWSSIPLSNIEHPEYSVEEMLTEENTTEIFEQLSQNVEPVEIAKNMETKTSIKWETWIPIIFMLIQTLFTAYDLFIKEEKPSINIEINNSYNIEIEQLTLDESYDYRFNEIQNQMQDE